MKTADIFSHVSETLSDVLKEVRRRHELRQQIEAERARPVSDAEYLAIAERSGVRI